MGNNVAIKRQKSCLWSLYIRGVLLEREDAVFPFTVPRTVRRTVRRQGSCGIAMVASRVH
jgi:hypothetical protein